MENRVDTKVLGSFLHRVVQYMLLMSGVDKQHDLLQKVHTMTTEDLVAWYQQLLNIQSWNNNRQFVNAAVGGLDVWWNRIRSGR